MYSLHTRQTECCSITVNIPRLSLSYAACMQWPRLCIRCANNTYNVRCTAGWQSHSRDIDIHTKCESVQIGIITVFTTGLMTCTRTPCAYARRNIACRRDGRHVMHYQHIYHVHSLPSLISQLIGPWRRFQTVRYRRSCRYMYEVLSCRNNFIL